MSNPETTDQPRLSLPSVSWGILISSLWILGSLSVLVVSTYRIIRFHGLVRHSAPADMATERLVESTIARLGESTRRPRVRLVNRVVPPLLWPLGHTPAIVLPALWWQTAAEAERETVFMHELIHWRRGDHWVRLIQWIASIVFWWHPLVWVARRELHRLEEQCCDAEVMHQLPASGRSYASALLSTSQWLDDSAKSSLPSYQPSLLAVPMSLPNEFESFHRRIEMLPTLTYHPWTLRRFAMFCMLAMAPLAIGLTAIAETTPAPDDQNTAKTIDEHAATLTGQVTDLDGDPIANAKIRVAIPAAELRQGFDPKRHRQVWGTTDGTGHYSIDVDGIEKETSASIDILHRGHRRLVGTLMSGGDPNEVTLSPGEDFRFYAKLPKALYFAGQVVDETGKPIEGVSVSSNLNTNTSSAGIERTTTDAEGRFAVYGYEAAFFNDHPTWDKHTASISFSHDLYIDAEIEKIEDLEPSQRDDLRLVMRRGYSIGGAVTDADGAPASNVVLSISQKDPYQRKAVRTDAKGRFRMDGVSSAKSTLRVVDVPGNRKSIQELTIGTSNTEMKIVLKPIESPITTTYPMLGMTLADVTSVMNEAYDLNAEKTHGVMVVDPGKTFRKLEIGDLRAGYVFWMVGNDRVTNLKGMVQRLVAEAKSPTIPPGAEGNVSAVILNDDVSMVRVVYSYNNEHFHGTNTQYMRLTAEDVSELEKLLESLSTDEQ